MRLPAQRFALLAVLAWSGFSRPATAASLADLYQFTGGPDGAGPSSAMVTDQAANLYGAAAVGGQGCSENPDGCGTLFRLSAAGALTTLHIFNGLNGQAPRGLAFRLGRLYGSAYEGGTSGDGTLFSMNADGSDFTVLHSFDGSDGFQPRGNIVPVGDGSLFGVTEYGGDGFKAGNFNSGYGVFFFRANDGGFHVIHKFTGGADGRFATTLINDSAGNLFGTTSEGGACNSKSGCGTIFKYDPDTRTYATIYTFSNDQDDGYNPQLGAAGPDGTLYGVSYGGADDSGTLFSLTPGATGYTFTLLADFPKNAGDVNNIPTNPPSLAENGDLVGATGTSYYGYANGHLTTLGRVGPPPLLPTTYFAFLIGKNATLYGSSEDGPQPCTTVTGGYQTEGCGYIFSYLLH